MYFGPALSSRQQYQLPSGYPTAPAELGREPDVASIVNTLLRRRRVFLAIFVGFVSLVVLWTLLTPRSYTATTKLLPGMGGGGGASHSSDTTLPLLNALLALGGAQSAETYVDLMQQSPVASQVVQNLKLNTGASELLRHVIAKPVTNTSIINLSVTWSDPQTAAQIANEFASVFISRERDLVAGQAGSAIDFLTREMPAAEARMRSADKSLADFEASHPGVYLGGGDATAGNTSDSAVLAAQQKYAQAKVDVEQAQAQLASVNAQMASTVPTINGASNITQNPVVSQLQTQLAQVEVQLESARKQYTDQHPAVLALQEQKAQLEREIGSQPGSIVSGNSIVPNPVYQQLAQQAATLRSQIAGDRGQLKTLDVALGRMNGAMGSLPAQSVELANLQRKSKMAEDVYTALQQKYNEAIVAKTTALSDVSVTQPATAAGAAVKPDWKMNLLLGIVLGIALAFGGVFAVEFLDSTFKDEEDVQRTLALPLLASIPHLTTGTPRKLPWLRALTVESFLQLVTALRYSSDKPLRTLLITSPNQGDGKSTVAMSTAIAMAEMEPKVILVDADLRKPTLHTKMDLSDQPGLSDCLVGTAKLEDAIQATKYDGLYLLSAGARVPNPMKLIHSERLNELITELLTHYRAIIFDSPALLPVYDAAALGAKVDGTVLVLAAGSTDMPSTKRALQRLSSVQDVNLLGIVLNKTTPTAGYASYYLNVDSPMPLPRENGVTSQQ